MILLKRILARALLGQREKQFRRGGRPRASKTESTQAVLEGATLEGELEGNPLEGELEGNPLETGT